jgi:hypothetical protein
VSKLKGINATRVRRLLKKLINGEIFVVLFPALSFYFLQKRYRSYIKNLSSKNLPLILRIEYGGLGDHLVYSAFPEAISKKYGVKTEISLHSTFSSNEIKDFVWGMNPYVSFSPEKGRSFSIPNFDKYKNYNEILLALFSLESPPFSVYYRPSIRSEVSDKVICDLTVGPSNAYNAFGKREFWDAVLDYLKDNFKKEDLLLLDPVVKYPDKRLMNYVRENLGIKTISVGSIRELADIIYSAKGRVLLDSGAKSVAAAYEKPSVILVRGFVNKYFSYQGNNYVTM